MSFNPDPQKQAVELIFSRKRIEIDHPVVSFNDIPVKQVNEHKHLGIVLDSKLSFSAHIKSSISKTRKGIGLQGGVHNMLRVRVCAAHMGGFLGPKFSKQGSLFRQTFLKQGWVVQKLAKIAKKGGFPPKFIIKVGMTASFGN